MVFVRFFANSPPVTWYCKRNMDPKPSRFNLYNRIDQIGNTDHSALANGNETVESGTHVVMGVSASTSQGVFNFDGTTMWFE